MLKKHVEQRRTLRLHPKCWSYDVCVPVAVLCTCAYRYTSLWRHGPGPWCGQGVVETPFCF